MNKKNSLYITALHGDEDFSVPVLHWYIATEETSCGPDSRDFVPFQQNGSEIVPFLCNTYKPGRCVALERIEFDKLFHSSI